MRHEVQWTAPAPFWPAAPDRADAARLALRRPAILRFATDSFMDEFNRTLETDPPRLRQLEARYETWKEPAGSSAVVEPAARPISSAEQRLRRLRAVAERKLTVLAGGASPVGLLEPPPSTPDSTGRQRQLKLYQPAHQRFYLVAAALVCRQPGLPDRAINAAHQERSSFVLRRVRTTGTGSTATREEYGFVLSSNGGTWTSIADPLRTLASGEEKLPLFAVNFKDDEGHKRRVMAGLIPAGRRESYVGASQAPGPSTGVASAPAGIEPTSGDADPGAPAPPLDARIALLTAEVIEPWKALIARAEKTRQMIATADGPTGGIRREGRETIQVASWYILLDFATFLSRQLKEVWQALPSPSASLPDPGHQAVYNALAGTSLPNALFNDLAAELPAMTVKRSLREALVGIMEFEDILEAADGGFTRPAPTNQWPDFLFPLADAERGEPLPPLNPAMPAGLSALSRSLRRISALRNLIAEALPTTPTGPVPDLPIAAERVMAPDEPARFVLRCVFERPDCVEEPVLSAPSEEFEIASFFDPDAPARPIRIALPIDTSPAGFRRAPKNTAFMVSDILCGQIARAKGLGFIDLVLYVLPWPFHKELPNAAPSACKTDAQLSLGMICSLSIPIITICALIVLIIMVSLLDIIFRWLPYLIFCFPLPGFSAKPPKTT